MDNLNIKDVNYDSDCVIVFEGISEDLIDSVDESSWDLVIPPSRRKRKSKQRHSYKHVVDIDKDESDPWSDKKDNENDGHDEGEWSPKTESHCVASTIPIPIPEETPFFPLTQCVTLVVHLKNSNRGKVTSTAINRYFSKYGRVKKVCCRKYSKKWKWVINLTNHVDDGLNELMPGSHEIKGVRVKVRMGRKFTCDMDGVLAWNASYSNHRIPFDKLRELVKVPKVNQDKSLLEIFDASKKGMQELDEVLREKVMLNEEDYAKRVELVQLIESVLIENGLQCKLHMYGSSVNELGFKNGDIDIFVELVHMGNWKNKLDHDIAETFLQDIHIILKQFFRMFIPYPIGSRVPIIKIDFNYHRSLFLNANGIKCDISISTSLGLHNSKLIAFLCELQPKFQSLAIIIRFWAKTCKFIASEKMSSYSWTMLVIYYCQQLDKPLLPPIEKLCTIHANAQEEIIVDSWNVAFCTDKEKVDKSENNQSLDELVIGFFHFYSLFNFSRRVICPRKGVAMSKSEFIQEFACTQFRMKGLCQMQDVFDMGHNLTCNVTDELFSKVCDAIKNVSRRGTHQMFGDNNCSYTHLMRCLY